MHTESLRKGLEPEGRQCGEMALEEEKVSPPAPPPRHQGILPRPIGVPAGTWRTRVLPRSCHRERGVTPELT